MARQKGWVQLEQSNMRLELNMAKMAKEGFSRAAIEEMKYIIQKPSAEFREEKKQGAEFPGDKKVNAAIQRNPAMLCENQTSVYLPCQNGAAKNPQTHCRRTGTGAPPPDRCRVRTPVPTQPLPGRPSAPTGNPSGVQPSQIVDLPAGWTYSNSAHLCSECIDDEETEPNTDFDPDMLTDEG